MNTAPQSDETEGGGRRSHSKLKGVASTEVSLSCEMSPRAGAGYRIRVLGVRARSGEELWPPATPSASVAMLT